MLKKITGFQGQQTGRVHYGGKASIQVGEKSLVRHLGESLDTLLELSFTLTHHKSDEEVMMAAGVRNPLIYASKGSDDLTRRIMVFNEAVEKILSYTARIGGIISFNDGKMLSNILTSHELIDAPEEIMERKDHERNVSSTTFSLDTELLSTKIIAYIHAIMKRTDTDIAK